MVDPRDVCCDGLGFNIVGEPNMAPICAGDYLCQKLGLMHDGGGGGSGGEKGE